MLNTYCNTNNPLQRTTQAACGEILKAGGYEKAQIAHRLRLDPATKNLSLRYIAEHFFCRSHQAILHLLKKYPFQDPSRSSLALLAQKSATAKDGREGFSAPAGEKGLNACATTSSSAGADSPQKLVSKQEGSHG